MAVILETKKEPPPNENALEFILADSPEKFAKGAWHLKPLTDERRAIVEYVQPNMAKQFPPDERWVNESFGILNDWARKDRHRHLHIAGSWAGNAKPKLHVPPGATLDYMLISRSGLLEDQREIARFRLEGWQPGMKIEANPDLTIDVAINEVPLPRHEDDTLSERCFRMRNASIFVLRVFEKSFGLTPAPFKFL